MIITPRIIETCWKFSHHQYPHWIRISSQAIPQGLNTYSTIDFVNIISGNLPKYQDCEIAYQKGGM